MTTTAAVRVPANVPEAVRGTYLANMQRLTHGTGRIMLFAGDQKVEHLNEDFYPFKAGEQIAPEDNDPRHLFRIAQGAGSSIGCFATQYGMVSLYGPEFPEIPYLVKVNSKSHLVNVSQADPVSTAWVTVEQIVRLREMSGLNIVGVGYTIYLGSEHEAVMLAEAGRLVADAHAVGLPVVFWIYPRGKSLIKKDGDKTINQEKHPKTITGSAGVGAALGADFVKVNPPDAVDGKTSAEWLRVATEAAGVVRVICAGGSSKEGSAFLRELHEQLQVGGTAGNATGRNIHQRPLDEAVRFCHAIAALTYGDRDPEFAARVYEGSETYSV
jgi:fructose-bisphosphate aldolase / 6-deoxy-5-ketofructose 1-phosphate synthase